MIQFDVDKRSSAVEAMSIHWDMIAALIGGTAAMRNAPAYLPQWPNESRENYVGRLSSATLFPAYSRTTAIWAAKPFARPMAYDEGMPSRVQAFMDDVDMYGTDVQPFAGQILLEAMRFGLMGILVDAPINPGVRTVAEERANGLRPFFTKYTAASILGWRAVRDAKGSHLTLLRLKESVVLPDGPWGEKTVVQVRVLTPGRWEVWRKREDVQDASTGTRWMMVESGATSLPKIPFVFFYGLRKDFGVGLPPLLDLAYMNVEHWQSASDQQTINHVARVPILFAKGFSESDSIIIGANTAARSNNVEADLKFIEHTGAAIEAGRQSILDLEDRMRQTGAELLIQQPANVTATAVQSDSEGSRTTLQAIVEDFEESLEQCLSLMGEWIGEPFDAEVELFKDFSAANLSEKGGDLLLRAANDGHLSSETTFNSLKRMDIVHPDVKWDDEKQRIASQPKPDDGQKTSGAP